MKVALVHDWLIDMHDEERCLEVLCELFPSAPLFTLFVNPARVSESLNRMAMTTSMLQHFPWITPRFPCYALLFPAAIEQFDFQGYDLVISNSRHIAKGVLTQPGTCHICYSHASALTLEALDSRIPERRANPITRLMHPFFSPYFRVWDVVAARRVDYFVARSALIAGHIRKYYRRQDVVVIDPSDRTGFKNKIQEYIQNTMAAFQVQQETERRSFLQTHSGRHIAPSQV